MKYLLLLLIFVSCNTTKKEYHVTETYTGSYIGNCIMYRSDSIYADCNCRIYDIKLLDRQGSLYKQYYDTVCRKYPVKDVGRPFNK